MAKDKGLEKVFVHAFLDGRDVPPASAKAYLVELEEKMQEIGVGKIATISGRYYAMDRDNRWDRVEKAFNAIVYGKGREAASAVEALENSYKEDVTDEFVLPAVILERGKPTATVEPNDGVMFFNFRFDRARQLTRAFVDEDFQGFVRTKPDVKFLCMTRYDETIDAPFAFGPIENRNTLGEWLSKHGKRSLELQKPRSTLMSHSSSTVWRKSHSSWKTGCFVPSPQVATRSSPGDECLRHNR